MERTTLWSNMPEAAWLTLEREGVLRSDPRLVWKEFPDAYVWMIDQMTRRIGPPPEPGIFPIWAWTQKPDLRTVRFWWPIGEKMCLVKFEPEADGVLLSDYDAWHFVLNKWYLSESAAADAAFDRWAKTQPVEAVRAAKLASWEHVFDLEWGDPDWWGKRILQATVWEVKLADVRDVRPFVGAKA